MAKNVFKIYKIRVITTPNIDNGGYIPSYKVYCKYALFYNSAANYKPTKKYTIKDDPHSDFFPFFNRKKEEKKKNESQDGSDDSDDVISDEGFNDDDQL